MHRRLLVQAFYNYCIIIIKIILKISKIIRAAHPPSKIFNVALESLVTNMEKNLRVSFRNRNVQIYRNLQSTDVVCFFAVLPKRDRSLGPLQPCAPFPSTGGLGGGLRRP